MTSAVEPKGVAELPAALEGLFGALANMQEVARQDGGDGAYMKFSKGKYSFGVDGIEPQEKSYWVVNPNSFTHGYQAWGDGELLGEEVATMRQPPIVKTSLPAHTYVHPDTGTEAVAKWAAVRGFQLVCTNGEDEGETCYLAGTSLGLVKAVQKLIAEVVGQMKKDPSSPVPVIELLADSYKHKKYGKIHTPEFKVVDWVELDAITTHLEEAEGDELEGEAPEGEEPEGEKTSGVSAKEEADLDAADKETAEKTRKPRGRAAAKEGRESVRETAGKSSPKGESRVRSRRRTVKA